MIGMREIDRSNSGDHVADEIFVARNIDNSRMNPIGQIQFSEPEVDRDLSRLLFRQTIGIGAGERFNERALAVIDMTGSGDNEMLGHCVQAARMASTTRSSCDGKIVRRSSLNDSSAM